MFDPAKDVHGDTMKRLGSRLTVAAAELRRAIDNGYMGDREGTLRIAARLEQIAYRILADNEKDSAAA